MPDDRPPFSLFLVGLACVTASTLGLEMLGTRLLSVVTWYHLTFLALSIAMSGMAAGALYVFSGGERFSEERAPGELAHFAGLFAWSALISHLVSLCIPVSSTGANGVLSLAVLTGVLTVPFVISGVVVAIALTRIPGPTGRIYAVDLLGASMGSVVVLPLLQAFDLTTAAYGACVLAAVGAACFALFARRSNHVVYWALASFVLVAAGAQVSGSFQLRVTPGKATPITPEMVQAEYWTIHGHVAAGAPTSGPPFYWGPGALAADEADIESLGMVIDGLAGTRMTRWDGTDASLQWVRHDVTALPYTIRKGGDVAVIGVGGGRDVLSALWGDARSVVGVEINRAFLDLLTTRQDFAGIAGDPRVTLVHDEARSWFTRTDRRFDVIQMSLIDTWAATGAGAFALSENGLYTVEAFTTFLERLEDDGILSVSRWYSPGVLSETTRLVSLTAAALLDEGVPRPRECMVLVTRENVSTMLVARRPFTEAELEELGRVAAAEGFEIVLSPKVAAAEQIERIATATDRAGILAAVADSPLDLSPPTDDRPYFFTLLLPGASIPADVATDHDGVLAGNLVATRVLNLAVLASFAALLALVGVPLVGQERPELPPRLFGASLLYFSLIGGAYMLTQVGFLQRLGPYLGHPVYAVSVVLFSMILASGVGASLSDRLDPYARPWLRWGAGTLTAASLVALRFLLPVVTDATVAADLPVRATVAVVAVAPVSLLMGWHFPLGMRAVLRLSKQAAPWMWGVNGGAGVLASATAVVMSMWFGIGVTLLAAAALYAALSLPASVLWGAVSEEEG